MSRRIYNPYTAGLLPHGDLVHEYNRLKRNIKRRINTIKKSGEFPNASIVQLYDRKMPVASKMNDRQLAHYVSELDMELSRKTSSLRGLRQRRRRTIETLNERGIDFVNEQNFEDFMYFMEDVRLIYGAHVYASDDAADFFQRNYEPDSGNATLLKDFLNFMEDSGNATLLKDFMKSIENSHE